MEPDINVLFGANGFGKGVFGEYEMLHVTITE
jgi:hypothetical protein